MGPWQLINRLRWLYRRVPLPAAVKRTVRHAYACLPRWIRALVDGGAINKFDPYALLAQLNPIEVDFVDGDYPAAGGDPPFSCVTTVLNEESSIQAFLASIRSQELLPDEVIVVDGGSTDGTVQLVKGSEALLPFRLVIIEPGRVNIAGGRNIGIAAARNEVIVLVDAGCELRAAFFQNLLGPVAVDLGVDLVAGCYTPKVLSRHSKRFIPDLSDPKAQERFLPSARAVCIKKTTWRAAGGFPEYLTLTGEDTLFDVNYRRHCKHWVVSQKAVVEWAAPTSRAAADQLAYRYGVGDGESGYGDFIHYNEVILSIGDDAYRPPLPSIRGYLDGRKQRGEIEVQRRNIKGVVVILSGVPFTDSGGGQRCSQLAMAFVRGNHKVVFVNIYPSFEEPRKLYFDIDYSLCEFYGLADFSVRDLKDRYAPFPDVQIQVILEFPHPALIPVLHQLRVYFSERLSILYDYIDNWHSALGWDWYSQGAEKLIVDGADHLIASARTLQEDLERRSGRPVSLVANAVNDSLFDFGQQYPRPADLPPGDRIVMYVGALWGDWFDWDLLGKCADRIGDAQFVLVGGVDKDRADAFARERANVCFLGLKPQNTLPAYLAHAKVCHIPFTVDRITQYVNPLKVYEYLAMRKPVVVTDMPELQNLPSVQVADSSDQYIAALRLALAGADEIDGQVAEFVSGNNWSARVGAIDRVGQTSPTRSGPWLPFRIVRLDQLAPQDGEFVKRLQGWDGIIDILGWNDRAVMAARGVVRKRAVHERDYEVLKFFSRPDDVCLDIGANVGQSIVAIKVINPDIKVVSFEPNELLHAVVKEVGSKFSGCTCHDIGLGDTDCVVKLYTPALGERLLVTPLATIDPYIFAGEQGLYVREIAAGVDVCLVEQDVRLVTGDKLDLRPTFIKVDVEGAELGVLKGLAATIERYKPLAMIEKSPGIEHVFDFLSSMGYWPYRYEPKGRALCRLDGFGSISADRMTALPLNVFWVHDGSRADLQRRGLTI